MKDERHWHKMSVFVQRDRCLIDLNQHAHLHMKGILGWIALLLATAL